MNAAAALYVGGTTHARLSPTPHRFGYRFFQLLIDVDHTERAFAGLWAARLGRSGLFSFNGGDHGYRDGRPLRTWVLAQLAQAGVAASTHSIRLLCFPRVLGFVFNPLSIFFVHDATGRLEAVIYEVNNTFGQTHAYVAPATGAGVERQAVDKAFFVSPFYGVEGEYQFEVTPPGEIFDLVITKAVNGKADFIATSSMRREDLTNARLMGLFFQMPMMTFGVVVAIHWQALRLWAKGARLKARPPGPSVGASVARTVPAP